MIVGDDINVAATPSINPTAHRNLFAWLRRGERAAYVGTSRRRCQQLRSGARQSPGRSPRRSSPTSDIAMQPTPHAVVVQFARLREIPWLPARGRLGGHAATSRGSLCSSALQQGPCSQSRSLSSRGPRPQCSAGQQRLPEVARRSSSQPTPKQVVDHLLWCVEQGQPVGEGTWIYLNQRADDPALDALEERPCLLIAETGTYVAPESRCTGEITPSGGSGIQLGPRFADYRALLEGVFGCVQHPDPADAVDVLLDVAAHHGGEQAPLLAEDGLVVNADAGGSCPLASRRGRSAADTASRTLRLAEVVLDGRGWLSKPTGVFFRDVQTLAERFGPEVHGHLIDRPDGQWRALAAAGVRGPQ